MRDIILKNDLLEKQLNEVRDILYDVANERSTTSFYDFLRFMPITNMFVDVFGMISNLNTRLLFFFLFL